MKRRVMFAIGALLILFLMLFSISEGKIELENATMKISQTPQPQITQLKIDDVTVGNGAEVKKGDTVVMNYKGTLLNGKEFDSSYRRNQPFETKIGVGQVIKGWDQGIPGMKIGGKRRLTIPASMAYGEAGMPPVIPPNSPLIFEVELLEIK